jgi:hypothetical protein
MTAEHELPDPLAPVDSDDALLDRWRLVLDGETFTRRTLWVTWYDDRNVALPVVVPVEDLPPSPDEALVDSFGHIVGDVLRAADGAWVSCALVRPGSAMVTSEDRAWAAALHASLRHNAVPTRPLVLATARRLRQLVMDDL